MEHRSLYAEYQSLKPRKQPKFYEDHRTELTLYEYAQRYFSERNIGSDFLLTAWKEELKNLAAEKGEVYREYNAAKAQFSEVEAVRLGADNIAREASRNMNLRKRETQERSWER